MATAVEKKLTQEEFTRIERMVKSQGFRNRLHALAKFVMPFNKSIRFHVNMGGGSYTDGDEVVIGIHQWFWTLSWDKIVMGAKALVAHELEHVVSSDFPAFMKFQDQVYRFFKKNYNLENGRAFGAQLLNSTEDGRIEKKVVNRLKGMLKYIQFLNGTAWKNSPAKGEDLLREYTLNICYMATSGVWMQNFDAVYGGTRMEEELEKVKPLIIKAINQPTTKDCGNVTMEIIKQNADFIAELLTPSNQQEQDGDGDSSNQQQGDPTDSLDRTKAPTTTEAMNNNDVEITESSHFVNEEENKKSKPTQPKDEKDEKSEEEEEANENGSGSSNDSDDEEQEEANGSGASEDSDNEDDSDETSKGEDGSGNGQDDTEEADANDSQEGAAGDDSDGQSEGGAEGDDSHSEEGNTDNQRTDDRSTEGSPNVQDTNEDSNGDHPEEHKSIEELIQEAVEEVVEELREENEQAIEQSNRENERIEQENERINNERKKVELTEQEKTTILNLPNGATDRLTIRYDDQSYVSGQIPTDLNNKTRTFRKEVEKIFLNKQGFNKKNRRQGRLDVNQLWRVPIGDVDLFSQKGRPQDSDYAVSVLVDNSGSMSQRTFDAEKGDYIHKTIPAKEAVVTLEEGLKGIIPLMITQFDFGYHVGINHRIIRSFEDMSKDNRSQERININESGGGNGDGYSIKIAHRQLMKRPERQKVLFVLSDGEPSAYYNREVAYDHVKEAVKEAREDGVIVIAIRFGDQNFLEETADVYKRMYDHSYIACEPKDIRRELVKLLKTVIK